MFDRLDPATPAQRLRPLFTIGVHDIPFLLEDHAASKIIDSSAVDEDAGIATSGSGWIACTTDSILALKDDLWDVLITIPPSYSSNAKEKIWPTVESPKNVPMKATQRDLRRFRSMRAGLRPLEVVNAVVEEDSSPPEASSNETQQQSRPCLSTSSGRAGSFPDEGSLFLADAADKIVEPMTWSALAYSGFMWWASAGEQRRPDEAEESAQDATLLADLAPPGMPTMHAPGGGPRRRSGSFNALNATSMDDSTTSLTARRTTTVDGLIPSDVEEDRARVELAIIAYFHRLTTQLLTVLAEIVESSDDDDMVDVAPDDTDVDVPIHAGEDEDQDDGSSFVRVDSDALANMGLDVWSQADANFVKDATSKYFSRRAYVEGKGVEVCGLRVC